MSSKPIRNLKKTKRKDNLEETQVDLKGGATLNILALNRRLLKHTVSLNILGEWVIQKL